MYYDLLFTSFVQAFFFLPHLLRLFTQICLLCHCLVNPSCHLPKFLTLIVLWYPRMPEYSSMLATVFIYWEKKKKTLLLVRRFKAWNRRLGSNDNIWSCLNFKQAHWVSYSLQPEAWVPMLLCSTRYPKLGKLIETPALLAMWECISDYASSCKYPILHLRQYTDPDLRGCDELENSKEEQLVKAGYRQHVR